jgi:hypothetical protein
VSGACACDDTHLGCGTRGGAVGCFSVISLGLLFGHLIIGVQVLEKATADERSKALVILLSQELREYQEQSKLAVLDVCIHSGIMPVHHHASTICFDHRSLVRLHASRLRHLSAIRINVCVCDICMYIHDPGHVCISAQDASVCTYHTIWNHDAFDENMR